MASLRSVSVVLSIERQFGPLVALQSHRNSVRKTRGRASLTSTLFSTSASVLNTVHAPQPHAIGKMIEKRPSNHVYESGQYFIHRVFAYRGVVLFPWKTELTKTEPRKPKYDDDRHAISSLPGSSTSTSLGTGKIPPLPEPANFYQVLIDNDDLYYVNMSSDSIVVHDGAVKTTRSFDTVSHDDIIPFVAHDPQAVTNKMLDYWFQRSQFEDQNHITWSPKESFLKWRKSCEQRLKSSQVVTEESNGVRVTVIPFYCGKNFQKNGQNPLYWWMYSLRVENNTNEELIIGWRDLKVYCESSYNRDSGYGIDNMTIKLPLSTRAYQQNKVVRIPATKGHVWGKLHLHREEDNSRIDVDVPTFHLEIHPDTLNANKTS